MSTVRELLDRRKTSHDTFEGCVDLLCELADAALPAERRQLTLLDVGCAEGERTALIARRLGVLLANVTGLEFVEERLQECRRRFTAHRVDLECDPFPLADETIDLVICNQVFEHVKNIHWLLAECHRVLKPRGSLVVGVPNLASLHNRVLLAVGRQPTSIGVLSAHVRGFTPSALIAFLESQRLFAVRARQGYGFYPFPPRWVRGASRRWPDAAVVLCCLAEKREGDRAALLRFFTEEISGTPYTVVPSTPRASV